MEENTTSLHPTKAMGAAAAEHRRSCCCVLCVCRLKNVEPGVHPRA